MDTFSTAYDFAMHDSVDADTEIAGRTVRAPMPRAPLHSVEAILDGLDAVTATFEPVRR